jgi:NADH dehydrogenase
MAGGGNSRTDSPLAVVTGAFSYTGSYVARELLARGWHVRTLTCRRPPTADAASAIEVRPLDFTDPDALAHGLAGASLFVNTYWIRYPHAGLDFADAVRNSETLFAAAERAGVGRIVHVSVSNPERGAALPYFQGKLVVERALRESALSWAIVRPTLIFGRGDILVNNIAWCLRRAPLFTLPGRADYRIQPVSGDDLGRIVCTAAESDGNPVWDAAGPELLTFRELVHAIAEAVDGSARIRPAPAWLALALARLASVPLRDRMLTRDEIRGLIAELLVSDEPPRGTEAIGPWLGREANRLGRSYASEFARHFHAGADRGAPVSTWS